MNNTTLHQYGVGGNARQCFSNYLVDHTQNVSLNNVNSTIFPVKCSVPQGLILGPLLFILLIKDIIIISKLSKFIMFHDVTNFFSHTNLTKLYENVNIELIQIKTLSINIIKTNFIYLDK